ncbi:unnamed protein product [Cylicocyclus nassatus]|uniref:Uncharacterized protein n=1 Tax=Cylicocyclus nassatus TaxID=53992 RepID=A0AA36GWU1_CYLNA|nr:unnamed protein product [Cylicocyclus nassatus]CAJ0599773.1 unnamed protein product [Cylicocyclus nassatus]
MKLFLLLASWMPAFVTCAMYSSENQKFICVTITSTQEIPRGSPYPGFAYDATVMAGTHGIVAGNKITVRSDFWELEPGEKYWLKGEANDSNTCYDTLK